MKAHLFFLQSRVYTFMNDFCLGLFTLNATRVSSPFGSFGTEHTLFGLVQSVHHLYEGFGDRNVVGFAF